MSNTSTEAPPSVDPAADAQGRRFGLGDYGWVWVGLIGLIAVCAVLAPSTLAPSSLIAVLPFFAVLTLAAAGQCLVIMQRGLDLSIPGTFTVSAIVLTKFDQIGLTVPIAVLLSLGVAALIGAVNGFVVVKLSVSPLVTTLAMGAILLGVAYMISGGQYLSSPVAWNDFTRARILNIPLVVLLIIVVVVVLSILLRKSVVGRRFVIVGANPATARAAGIGTFGYQMGAYVMCALLAGVGGLLLAGFVGNATPGLGDPYLLSTVAAVVIGGTALTGGRGSLVATAGGALLLSQLDQLTASLGAPQSTQMFVQAAVLVLAFAVRLLGQKGLRRRFPSRRS